MGALVGVVYDVEANSSTVTSILDTKFSCGAYVQRNGDRAVATGDFSLMKDGLLKFDFLQDITDVNMGDQILTSGKGGVLPAALVVGTVQQVMTYPTGISRYATIKPAVDMSTLSNVYLITSFEITEAGGSDAAESSASRATRRFHPVRRAPGAQQLPQARQSDKAAVMSKIRIPVVLIAHIVFIIAVYILQSMVFTYVPISGTVPVLLPIAVAGIATFEGSSRGGGYGLLAGALCDISFNQPVLVMTRDADAGRHRHRHAG